MGWSFIPLLAVLVVVMVLMVRRNGGRKTLRERDQKIIDALHPIYEALNNNSKPDEEVVKELAQRMEVRAMLFRVLEQAGLDHLFPEELKNYQDAGASDLAFYLLHPAELGEVPAEVRYKATVERTWESPEGPVPLKYHVYQFLHRNEEWVAGVAGPTIGDDAPYAPSRCTATFYEPFDSKTPDEHVQPVHDSIWPQVAKRLVG